MFCQNIFLQIIKDFYEHEAHRALVSISISEHFCYTRRYTTPLQPTLFDIPGMRQNDTFSGVLLEDDWMRAWTCYWVTTR